MAESLTLIIKVAGKAADLVDSRDRKSGAKRLYNYIGSLVAGGRHASIDAYTSTDAPVAASGTFTLASAVATDAITIGTVTLTASSTPANENQWEIDGASDAADAASLAAAINAHSVLSTVVSAEAADEVVTVTVLQKGVLGNQVPISSADATITASGTFLTGGTGGASGAATTYRMGL